MVSGHRVIMSRSAVIPGCSLLPVADPEGAQEAPPKKTFLIDYVFEYPILY